jgi:protein-S-isoprenylcysteine O-methyltransferase Ste14
VSHPLIAISIAFWVALEAVLHLRDRVRGKGGTADDRGTRLLSAITITAAIAVAQGAATALRGHPLFRLPGTASWYLHAGLALIWAGLAIRVWAVAALGRAFRLTVEVDPGQELIDRGPYRWIRHPAYTGLLLITAGFGIAVGNWLSLAVALLAPLSVLTRRIQVEEQVLVSSMGAAYAAYRKRTKRLIPGVW